MTTETSERKTKKKTANVLFNKTLLIPHWATPSDRLMKKTFFFFLNNQRRNVFGKKKKQSSRFCAHALAWSAICFLRCTICLSPLPSPSPSPPTPLLVSNTCKQYHYDWPCIQCIFRFVGFLQALRALLSALQLCVIIIINITQEKLCQQHHQCKNKNKK